MNRGAVRLSVGTWFKQNRRKYEKLSLQGEGVFGSSAPTHRRPRAGSSGPTARYRTDWSRRCAWTASRPSRSEEHTSELQSLMRISYAVFCLKKKKHKRETEEIQN